jgi:hypothetical protein
VAETHPEVAIGRPQLQFARVPRQTDTESKDKAALESATSALIETLDQAQLVRSE